jgi:hypothetical protein
VTRIAGDRAGCGSWPAGGIASKRVTHRKIVVGPGRKRAAIDALDAHLQHAVVQPAQIE